MLFVPSPSDGRHEEQLRLLTGHADGLRERDLLVGRLFEEGPGDLDGGPVPPDDAAGTRESFGADTSRFEAVLVGKDGTAKFRSGEPVLASELFERVDAMPMRRREMREGRGDGCGAR